MSASWHIMDCGLAHPYGHHYWGAIAILGELRRRGIAASLYGHASAPADLVPGVQLVPLFQLDYYWPMSYDPVWGEIEDFVLHNRVMGENFKAVPTGPLDGAVVLFPTISHNQLLAIIRWAAGFDAADETAPGPAKIVCVLLYPPDWCPVPRPQSNPAQYYRFTWGAVPESVRRRVFLCAQTEAIASGYAPVLGMKPTVLPYYQNGAAADAPPIDAPEPIGERDIFVTYLGEARAERGFTLLPEIVAAALTAAPQLRFFIQSHHRDDPACAEATERLAALPRVQIHRGPLDPAPYRAAMQGADLLLLPYDPAKYGTRSSGVYLQAGLAGTPVLVPEGTWMATEMLVQMRGATFPSFAPDAVAAALVAALPRLPQLRARARRHAAELGRTQGTAAFIDAILALGTGAPALP